jgi:hypothetical protein
MGIEELLQRLQTGVTGVTGLHDCFITDFSVTPVIPVLPEVTESDLRVTPSDTSGSAENINEINDVTSVTLVTPEKNESQRGVHTCASCHNVSRYGNCTIPQQSGLAAKFMLISHPNNVADCDAFEPKLNPLAQEALALISIALREGVISEEDHLQATQSIREHSEDADYLHEWIQLIAACQESKTRRS